MRKIVYDGIKADFHIHSYISKHKDKGKPYLESNNMENINVLVKKLNENNVNMCAISDHDAFSYELYRELKKQEGKGTLKKILPAVEFSVTMVRNDIKKQIHVVTIFDDSDIEKVKNIENVLELKDEKPNYDLKSSFSEGKFLDILNKIDLNTICIAHQKNTLTSKAPSKNDINTLGEESFNEFLFAEYFEALEFKNKRNEVFNNISKSKIEGDLLRFITGSDCHDWSVYPKYNSDEKDGQFKYTNLKCLPTFKGVALAMTDNSWISLENNFFNQTNKVIDKLVVEINGREKSVPLSRGINVIIGDNSIGKSLFLHKITNYYRTEHKKKLSAINDNIVKGYTNYLEKNKITIKTVLNRDDIFEFDTQGEIRRKFNLNQLKDEEFFKDKYPDNLNVAEIKGKLINKIISVCKILENRFLYEKSIKEFYKLKVIDEEKDASSLTLTEMDIKSIKEKMSKLNSIVKAISEADLKLQALFDLIENKIEKNKIQESINYVKSLKTKYDKEIKRLKNNQKIANALNTSFISITDEMNNIKNTEDLEKQEYIGLRNVFISDLIKVLKRLNQKRIIDYTFEKYELKPDTIKYLEYDFVKKTQVLVFDEKYIKDLLLRPLNKTFNNDINKISEDDFGARLNQFDGNDALKYYKEMLIQEVEKDLSPVETIIIKKGDKEEVYSDGLNMRIYFNILSTYNKKQGVYLIDQPEDDISQRSIKDFVLDDFKRMSKNRQVIIVTHNPQFVVNLDADNVIHFSKHNNEFEIENGALEFENEQYKMLDIVANTLEGGVETIRKRWKRYEKNIHNKIEW